MSLTYVKPERISLSTHPELREKWVQDRIADDPAILGLGDLLLKDKERIQPRAGRLDLLLQDAELNTRYEVEIMLGETDESHIIRTIEYWDLEKRRYPQYEHYAVIVAEDITSRFLNVIALFNGFIPLIALQMTVLKFGDQISLIFTKVFDAVPLGLDDGRKEAQPATDRNYWETDKSTKETVALADEMLGLVKTFAPAMQLNYVRYYIGLAKDGLPDNFAIFFPKRSSFHANIYLKQSPEIDEQLESAGLDAMEYDKREKAYRLRLTKDDIKKHSELITQLLKMAYGLDVPIGTGI
jgi:hypothetical protein